MKSAIHSFDTIDCDAFKPGPFKLGKIFQFSKKNKR